MYWAVIIYIYRCFPDSGKLSSDSRYHDGRSIPHQAASPRKQVQRLLREGAELRRRRREASW